MKVTFFCVKDTFSCIKVTFSYHIYSEIPYVETRPALTERHRGQLSSVNLHPDPDKLGDILGTSKLYAQLRSVQL